jgi:hypothetical protein
MNLKNKLTRYMLPILAACLAVSGCQKMDRPPLGDYPQDTNPPGGPLKFYAAFDGRSVDSIRANFGVDKDVTFVDGISGKAMSAGSNGYIVFPSVNDFSKATSFTVAFWMKKNGPNPAGTGTSFAFGISSSSGIWTQQEMFLLFEDAGNPSSADLAAAKFYVNDQWFEFVGDKRIPNLLNNQWHHVAFVLDESTKMLTTYVDGAPVTANLPAGFGNFTKNNGKADFSKIGGLVIGGPGHFAAGKTPDGWMGNFNGQIDQFRLYDRPLSAAEISGLFSGKM